MPLFIRLLLATLLLGTQHVHAADAARPEVRLVAYKVVTTPAADGVRESLQPLQELRPGDTIEYEATYINRSSQTARDVQVTVPVPAGGLEYVAAQKAPLASTATADGKLYTSLPLTRMEAAGSGKWVARPVPLSEYRALRWNLGDLPAGASRSVRARMRLPATTEPAGRAG